MLAWSSRASKPRGIFCHLVSSQKMRCIFQKQTYMTRIRKAITCKKNPLGAFIRTRLESSGFFTISNVWDLPGVFETATISIPFPTVSSPMNCLLNTRKWKAVSLILHNYPKQRKECFNQLQSSKQTIHSNHMYKNVIYSKCFPARSGCSIHNYDRSTSRLCTEIFSNCHRLKLDFSSVL